MPLDIEINAQEKKVIIKLPSKFDFMVADNFRDAVRKMPKYVLNYEIDMKETEYMDAAALGSLMLLHHEKPEANSMSLINCNDEMRHLFRIMDYETMFSISSNGSFSQKEDKTARVA